MDQLFWPPLEEQLINDGIVAGPISTTLPGLPVFSMEFFSAVIWFVLKTVAVIFFHSIAKRSIS